MAIYKKKEYENSEEYEAKKKALDDLGAAPVYDPGETGIMATKALQEYLDRPAFSYDVKGDALYNQYADRYTQAGRAAMQDTMGQAAAMTGGYGNSYATTAGQQAYQGYMQELTDKIPELYQLAYSQYQDRGEELLNKYGLLSAEEEKNYGRYRDTLSDYLTEREYLTGRADAQAAQDRDDYWNTVNHEYGVASDDWSRDYQVSRDAVEDSRYAQEWDYQVSRDAVEDSQWERQFALSSTPTESSGVSFSDLVDYYEATGDASVFADYGIDTANIAGKSVSSLGYKDYAEISDYVAGLTDEGQRTNYLDWAVNSGAMTGTDAVAIARQNGFEYTPPVVAAQEGVSDEYADFEGWNDLKFISFFKGIMDTEGTTAAYAQMNELVSAGVIPKDMAEKYKKILAGKK